MMHTDVVVQNVKLVVAVVRRVSSNTTPPIILMHGFGSTKEDFVDLIFHPAFGKRTLVAYDAPGCGETKCEDLSAVSIEFLVATAEAVLHVLDIDRFHLVGHSMGGLAGLLLAHKSPDRVLSFVNIKGNLVPEDCFLSRQILEYPSKDASEFFDEFIKRAALAPSRSSALYAASLRHKVSPQAVYGIFKSMVCLSDHGNLMSKFNDLPFPKVYMYGEEYATLSYLPYLQSQHIELAEIASSGHFPMYSNGPETWDRITNFLQRVDPLAEYPYTV